jgi:hypothetical protein
MAKKKKQEELDPVVYSKDVVEFVTVATHFCSILEDISIFNKKEFLETQSKILGLLYIKGFMLPFEGMEEIVENPEHVTESDWNFIQESISAKLGNNEVFIDFYEPSDLAETINISLSEAFADVYQDIRNFTELYQIGNVELSRETLKECRYNFELHWGPRALLIINEIHNILFSGESLDDDAPGTDNDKNEFGGDRWVNHLFN